jgi:hypothetical protein
VYTVLGKSILCGTVWHIRRLNVKALRLLVLALLLVACRDITEPTRISTQPETLAIAPAMKGLKLGSVEQLTTLLFSGDSRRAVSASWSSDAPDVVAVSDDGRVRGVSVGRATIRATFRDLSAIEVVRVVPDYQGTWLGEYRVTACTRLRGDGSSYCRFILGVGLFIDTSLTQDGPTLEGTISVYSNTHVLLESGPVEGSIDASGALVLTGTATTVEAEEPSSTTLSDWRTTLRDDGMQMTGRFVKNRHFRNFFGWQDSREECETTFTRRVSNSADLEGPVERLPAESR